MIKKITIFIGNMGSGKSEVAINYALEIKKETNRDVKLLDLDIIKPYIRIRDVADKVKHLGIDLLMSDKKMRNADMPIVPRHMIDYLLNESFDMVIDVGGEERGCTTIAQFRNYFLETDLSVNLVVNPFRPFSDSREKIIQIISSLENTCGLKITGLVSNPHLRFQTSLDQVRKGTNLVLEASFESKVPLRFICVWHNLLDADFIKDFLPVPVLPLRLFLTFPWENGLMDGI